MNTQDNMQTAGELLNISKQWRIDSSPWDTKQPSINLAKESGRKLWAKLPKWSLRQKHFYAF